MEANGTESGRLQWNVMSRTDFGIETDFIYLYFLCIRHVTPAYFLDISQYYV